MSAPPFELLRFAGAPAGPEVAVLELEGDFDAGTWRARDRARLLVEAGERSVEMPPVATIDLPGGAWRGSYAVPLDLLDGAQFSLAVGRLLLELPAPDLTTPAGGPATHHVRLARETNELRRRLDQAEEARLAAERLAEEASARAAEAEEERDREAAKAAAELSTRERAEAEEREARAAVAEAVATADDRVEAAESEAERAIAALREEAQEREAEAERALAAERDERRRAEAEAREEHQRALAQAREEHEQALTAARAEAEGKEAERRRALETAEEEAARREEDAVATERARASVTRHELRAARAELESLRRELAVRRSASGRRPDRLRLGGEPENGTGETAAIGRDDRESDDEPTARTAPTTDATGDEPTIRASRGAATEDHAPSASEDAGEDATRALPPTGNGSGDDTTVRTPPGEALTVAAERTARVPPDEGEGFRVLTPRAARPRHRIEDEHEPDDLPPGAAATGARSFEPAAAARSSDSARALAITALAVAIVAALLVIVLRVGLV